MSDQVTMIHPHYGILLSNEKEGTTGIPTVCMQLTTEGWATRVLVGQGVQGTGASEMEVLGSTQTGQVKEATHWLCTYNTTYMVSLEGETIGTEKMGGCHRMGWGGSAGKWD